MTRLVLDNQDSSNDDDAAAVVVAQIHSAISSSSSSDTSSTLTRSSEESSSSTSGSIKDDNDSSSTNDNLDSSSVCSSADSFVQIERQPRLHVDTETSEDDELCLNDESCDESNENSIVLQAWSSLHQQEASQFSLPNSLLQQQQTTNNESDASRDKSLRPKFAILKPSSRDEASCSVYPPLRDSNINGQQQRLKASNSTHHDDDDDKKHYPTPDWFFSVGNRSAGSSAWGPFSHNSTTKGNKN